VPVAALGPSGRLPEVPAVQAQPSHPRQEGVGHLVFGRSQILPRSLTCWRCPEPSSCVLMISAPCETQVQSMFSSAACVEETPVPYVAAWSESTHQGCCPVLRLGLVIFYSITVAEHAWTSPWDTAISTGASSPPRDCSSHGIRDRFPLVPLLVCMTLTSFLHLVLSTSPEILKRKRGKHPP